MAGFVHAPALIAAVFLNGVNIEGVRSQTFEKCRTVRLDEKGDVHLDCPGYQVEIPAARGFPVLVEYFFRVFVLEKYFSV